MAPLDAENGGSRPVPDPTVLTTEAIYREIQALGAIVDEKLETLRERLHGIDDATTLRLLRLDHFPIEMDEKNAHLRTIFDEKFASVAQQFRERDTRSERESRDNKVAVDAAFAAQKEAAAKQDESNAKAIAKSEGATSEAINKLSQLFDTSILGVTDKIDDLRARLTAMESGARGRETGADRAAADQARSRTLTFAVIGAVGTIVFVLIALGGIFAATGK